jgi:hypothetical protein
LFEKILLPAGLVEYVINKNRNLAWELVDIFLENDKSMISDELIACMSFASMIRLQDVEITNRWLHIKPVEDRAVFYLVYGNHETFVEFARAYPQVIVTKLDELVRQAVQAGRLEALEFLIESHSISLSPGEMLQLAVDAPNDAPNVVAFVLDKFPVRRAQILDAIKQILGVERRSV